MGVPECPLTSSSSSPITGWDRVGRHSSGECRRIIMQDESTATAVRDRDRGDRHEEGLAEAVTRSAHGSTGRRLRRRKKGDGGRLLTRVPLIHVGISGGGMFASPWHHVGTARSFH